MTWLRDHWRIVAGAALLLSHGGAFYAGRRSVAQPAVSLQQDLAQHTSAATAIAKKDEKAPGSLVRKVYRTDCAPGSLPVLASETIVQHGAEVITTDTQSRVDEQLQQHVDLRVTPASLPRWALGAGVEDPLGARTVQVTAGMRLLGPIWLRGAFTPARGLPGATLGAEVQW